MQKTGLHTRKILLLAVLFLMMAAPILIGGWRVIIPVFSIPLRILVIFLLMISVKWYCLSARLGLVLKANGVCLSTRRLVPIVCAHDFSSETTPGGIGGPITGYALLKAKGVSLAQATTAGLFTTLFDAIAVSSLLAFALILILFSASSGFGANGKILIFQAITLVTASTTLAVALLLFSQHLTHLIRWLPLEKLVPHSVHDKANDLKSRLVDAITKVRALPLSAFLRMFLLSLGAWSVRFSLLYLAILIANGHMDWPYTALIQFTSTLAGMATFLPGGFPGADLSMGALLSTQLDTHTLLSTILLWRLMTFYTNLLIGGISFLWLSATALQRPHAKR